MQSDNISAASGAGRLKNRIRELLPVFILAYVIIQPLLDTYILFDERVISLFGISPSTAVRFLGIVVLAGLAVYVQGFDRKFFALLGYIAVVAVYFVIHVMNASHFTFLAPGKANLSVISEGMYVFRLCLPMVLIYVIRCAKLNRELFFKGVVILSFAISGIIVLTNLLCISLDSYTNHRIKANIFSWFMGAYQNDSYNGLASKAFFTFANQISVIQCMLLSVMTCFALSRVKLVYFIGVFLQAVSMLMLGTRTSTYGAVLVLGASFLIYAFFIIIRKTEKKALRQVVFNLVAVLLVLASTIVILPKSPAIYRSHVSTSYIYHFDDEDKEDEEPEDPNKPKTFLTKMRESGIISEFYINSYPYQYDYEFWEEMMNRDSSERLTSRFVEEAMLKRAKEINNNPMDDWFGMSYCNTANIYNLERDFLYQYYSMGIAGVFIFLGPYVAILLVGIIKCLVRFKKLCTMQNVYILFGIALALGTSIYCGNSIDALFVTIILAFLCGRLLLNLSEDGDGMADGGQEK